MINAWSASIKLVGWKALNECRFAIASTQKKTQKSRGHRFIGKSAITSNSLLSQLVASAVIRRNEKKIIPQSIIREITTRQIYLLEDYSTGVEWGWWVDGGKASDGGGKNEEATSLHNETEKRLIHDLTSTFWRDFPFHNDSSRRLSQGASFEFPSLLLIFSSFVFPQELCSRSSSTALQSSRLCARLFLSLPF